MQMASRVGLKLPNTLLIGLSLALPGCGLVLGLGDFREGGAGGGGTGGAGQGGGGSGSTSTTSTGTTTGTGGCTSGQTECAGACVTLKDDNTNCGKCGKVCDLQSPSASTCADSVCQACAGGRADCDGLGTNACEAELASDTKNCGACGHTCAGACVASRCQPVVLASAVLPDLIVAGGGYVFWKDGSKAITQASTDGSNAMKLPITGAFAINASHVYSIEQDGVWRVPIAGGAAEKFITKDGVLNIAVDAKNLYATWFHDVNAGLNGDLQSYDLETKAPTPITIDMPGVGGPCPGDGLLFWLENAGIYKTSLVVGSAHTLVASTPQALQSPLRADADNLYWVDGAGVTTIPIFGADPATGAKPVPGTKNAFALAIDAESIYWSDGIDQLIRKAPKSGGAPVTLATGQGKVASIAVDDSFVYWTDMVAGTVMKVEKNP